MILVFGGVYQGKLAYAQKRFSNKIKIINDFDKWILELVQTEQNTEEAVRRFIKDNMEAVVLCNDISCGVVPVDAMDRKWREEVGRAMAIIANASDEVIRLFCGIPMRIK